MSGVFLNVNIIHIHGCRLRKKISFSKVLGFLNYRLFWVSIKIPLL